MKTEERLVKFMFDRIDTVFHLWFSLRCHWLRCWSDSRRCSKHLESFSRRCLHIIWPSGWTSTSSSTIRVWSCPAGTVDPTFYVLFLVCRSAEEAKIARIEEINQIKVRLREYSQQNQRDPVSAQWFDGKWDGWQRWNWESTTSVTSLPFTIQAIGKTLNVACACVKRSLRISCEQIYFWQNNPLLYDKDSTLVSQFPQCRLHWFFLPLWVVLFLVVFYSLNTSHELFHRSHLCSRCFKFLLFKGFPSKLTG